MKRSMVALAALSLSLTVAACEGAPDEAPDPTTTASSALSAPVANLAIKQPLPSSVTIDFDTSPGGAVAPGSIVDSTYAVLIVSPAGTVLRNSGSIPGGSGGRSATPRSPPPTGPPARMVCGSGPHL